MNIIIISDYHIVSMAIFLCNVYLHYVRFVLFLNNYFGPYTLQLLHAVNVCSATE